MNDVKDAKAHLTIKDILCQDTSGSYLTSNKTVEISAVLDVLKETFDRVQCLQRAIVVMCEGYHDFKAEYAKDTAELKRKLQDLGRNKVWISREWV